MIEPIVTYFDNVLEQKDYYSKLWGYIELIQQGDRQLPGKYISNGRWDDVSIFNRKSGTGYFRKLSEFTTVTSENDLISCKRMINITYPLRFVSVVKKDKLRDDNCYSSEDFAIELVKLIAEKENGLKNTLKARRVTINVNAWNTDAPTIFAQEYIVPNNNQIDSKYSYVAIDFDVVVLISRECITDYCN